MRYLDIADHLRSLITSGDLGPGGGLPSEAELVARFSASRTTVRRALEQLRDEGLVKSRKGSGWFAALDPVTHALGRFATVEAALEAAGAEAKREVQDFGFEPPPPDVADVLRRAPGDEVLRVRRLNHADGRPFGVVTVWVPLELASELSRADVERSTFYELLKASGVELGRAVQSIRAETADRDDVTELGLAAGAPMLVCLRITEDRDGRPVLVSEHRYPAHRIAFEVELPRVTLAGDGPVGLRLVEDVAESAAS